MVKIQQHSDKLPLQVSIPRDVEKQYGLKKGDTVGFALIKPDVITDDMIIIRINRDGNEKWVY